MYPHTCTMGQLPSRLPFKISEMEGTQKPLGNRSEIRLKQCPFLSIHFYSCPDVILPGCQLCPLDPWSSLWVFCPFPLKSSMHLQLTGFLNWLPAGGICGDKQTTVYGTVFVSFSSCRQCFTWQNSFIGVSYFRQKSHQKPVKKKPFSNLGFCWQTISSTF